MTMLEHYKAEGKILERHIKSEEEYAILYGEIGSWPVFAEDINGTQTSVAISNGDDQEFDDVFTKLRECAGDR